MSIKNNGYGLRNGGAGWARGVFGGSTNPKDMPKFPKSGLVRGGRNVIYVPNHESFGEFMLSEQMRDVTADVAEDIAIAAKGFSPQSSRGGQQEGRRMRDRFEVVKNAGVMKVDGNLRVMVEVENNARSAAPNEFGTRKNARHRMLGRAGALFGDFKPTTGGKTERD